MALPYEFSAKTIIEEGRASQQTVNDVKDWLSTTTLPELPEELIVLFLISCKNDVKATKETIQAYFRIKNEAPEIFNDRDVDSDELKKATETVLCASIPARMANNTVIHYFKLRDTNYQNFDLVSSMKLAYMIVDISQRRNPPNELVVILDMKGIGFMHLTKLRIGAIKKFLEFLQEAMPLRIQQIHVLNTTYIFDKMLAIARAFIKNELMAILKTHPPEMDMEDFYRDYVPAACLPKDYGGQLPSAEELNDKTIEQFRELKTFFEAEEKLRRFIK